MLCCSLGAFVMATMPMWRTWSRTWLKSALGYAPITTAAAFAIALWMFVAQHLDHYLERAQANDRSLLAEIMAQPLCTGAPAKTSVASVRGQTNSETR